MLERNAITNATTWLESAAQGCNASLGLRSVKYEPCRGFFNPRHIARQKPIRVCAETPETHPEKNLGVVFGLICERGAHVW